MPPREKPARKSGEAAAALGALETTYRVACRARGVPPHRPLLAQIQTARDGGAGLGELLLCGVTGAALAAVCEALAAYSGASGLACWGCSIGDELASSTRMQLAQQALADRLRPECGARLRTQPPHPLLAAGAAPAEQQQSPPPRPEVERCPCFGEAALHELSLALGAAGALTRLVLDHTLLGCGGVAVLAPGLARCGALRCLSLCHCGIGPAGAEQLAGALVPSGCGAVAGASALARRPSVGGAAASRLGGGAAPAAACRPDSCAAVLEQLRLSGNPLRSAGLQALAAALRGMPALQVLALADLGVTDVDADGVGDLVSALAEGPPAAAPGLAEIDFELNLIGDRLASLFLELLPARPSLVLVKLTSHLSAEVVAQLCALMAANRAAAARPARPPGKAKQGAR
ncbi:RanGAP [Scenedesmus sp. PABB004]|nr:RanGAP [Scenedesmus sp. PABB004]